MKEKLTIIYDVTTTCPHNCQICCMGAKQSTPDYRCELRPEERMAVMDQLIELKKIRDVRIDFSGGEIFWHNKQENVKLIEKATSILGRDKVGVSTSGSGVDNSTACALSKCVSDVEMTMDSLPGATYPLRPVSYAKSAAIALPLLKKYGVTVGIQTVLAKANSNCEDLEKLYMWLCEHDVDNWSLLRFYPAGRGAAFIEQQLSDDEIADVVRFIQLLDENNTSNKKPKIDFHYTIPGHEKYTTECRCVKKSIGILPDGQVTACFWAVNDSTEITDDKFNLGSVKVSSLAEILNGEKAKYWTNCSHCCEIGETEIVERTQIA